MSTIIGVHGISNEFEGPASLAANWLLRIQDGMLLAGRPAPDASQFACAFFGDLFRPSGKKSLGGPRLTSKDITSDDEIELLRRWCAEARRQGEPLLSPYDDGLDMKGRTPRSAQWCLQQLSKCKFFMLAGGESFILWLLQQVRGYLHNEDIRQAAIARLSSLVNHNTKVIVGHSLGSVVAYEALCAHPEWHVTTLVTLGSPLGIRNVVFDRLRPEPRDGYGTWPNVHHWINIADEGDIVALQKDLQTCFGNRVRDVRVHNGFESHSVLRYLNARETGEAIATGLG
jgi:hypothetical protein